MKSILITLLYLFFIPAGLILGQYQNALNKTHSSAVADSIITLLGNWELTSAKDIYIDDDYAYLLRDNSVEIIDIRNPTNPISISHLLLKQDADHLRILVSGNYVYVISEYMGYGLKIIDVSNKTAPIEVSFYKLENLWNGGVFQFVEVNNNFIYDIVGENNLALRIIDLSNPDNPKIIGESSKFNGYVKKFSLSGNFGYILTENELLKIDISNPEDLQIHNIKTGAINNSQQLFISNKYFYSIDWNKLKIFNDKDSLGQRIVGNYNFNNNEWINDVYENGDFIYVAITDYDTMTYFYSHPRLYVLDISDPSAPFEVNSYNKLFGGWWTCSRGYWSSMKVYNDYIITPISSGLNFIDISDPSNPVELNSYFMGGDGFKDVEVEGNYAYVTNFRGYLNVIDISDPAKLKLTGYYYIDGEDPNIFVQGKYAYIINYYDGNYLHIVDISNPTKPTQVSEFKFEGYCWDLFVQGKYVCLMPDGLEIIDVGNSAKPIEIGFCLDTVGLKRDVFVQGNYAYVAGDSGSSWMDRSTRFSIYNVSDPSKPIICGQYIGGSGFYSNILVSGNYAYLFGWGDNGPNSWLDVFDISSPSNPNKINDQQIFFSDTFIYDVMVSNQFVYITTGNGVEILDITDPSNIKVSDNFELNTSVRSGSFQDDRIYLLSDISGLYVLQSNISTDIKNESLSALSFSLEQNYPNPFNPTTKIKYSIPGKGKRQTGNVKLVVYDILGREIAVLVNEEQKPGYYEVKWNAGYRPSGVYFYRITTGSYIETKKMLLLR